MNNQKKKISTGVEDFKTIIDENGYLVDKTLMIKDVLESNAKVTLFTRPRRFEKTLVMSMLASFFDIRRDSRDLFEGLKIAEDQKLCELWMYKWPVIFFES